MNRYTLFEEYRLVERSENEVNVAWKGVHLLLFFLAFIFGSFCTFCFHMLMYLFDEKCVLFPKLLSLTSSRHNVIYEIIPDGGDDEESPPLPVDFVSTQWVEKSTCYLPTFVPLVSGIFGLVWTTMFLMCSTGSRTLTGLQRPWRVLPPVFVFSLAMGALCIYSSAVTHYGLKQLCIKLGELTGATSCTYTVNVATLAYERRIRGVYQATWLTIVSAWLHTLCWLTSALVALLRVLLAVDFQLVRISVDLVGDVDKLLENHEEQIRTVSPNIDPDARNPRFSVTSAEFDQDDIITHFQSQSLEKLQSSEVAPEDKNSMVIENEVKITSELSLVPDEHYKLAKLESYKSVPRNRRFIVKMIYELFDKIEFTHGSVVSDSHSSSDSLLTTMQLLHRHQKEEREGFELHTLTGYESENNYYRYNFDVLRPSITPTPQEGASQSDKTSATAVAGDLHTYLGEELDRALIKSDEMPKKKSNLKNRAIQTDKLQRKQKVTISEEQDTDSDSVKTEEKDTQTKEKDTQTKEKQD